MAILQFDNVTKRYCNDDKSLLVLKNIHLKVRKGEIIAITGPSGCGKSTMLNLISGLEKATDGLVRVNGDIGYMFQRDHLLEHRTVFKNIILGLEIIKEDKNEKFINEVNRMLKSYGLDEFKNHYPKELSGGMRQRVALIRTLAVNPDILLLDEPFASLDYQTKIKVIDDIYQIIRKERKTAIIVTHDISEAISIADKVIVMSKRPSSIKKVHEIKFDEEKELTPYEKRKLPKFSTYFDMIWSELSYE